MYSNVRELVAAGTLPTDDAAIAELLTNSDCTYLFQEGDCWDFKESWPFSYSDNYFYGLARLVCAFANSDGGIIIFGVDDKTRKGGRTKVIPNLDKFELALKQLTGAVPDLELRRFSNADCGNVDVLLVKRKGAFDPPFRFVRDAGTYKSNTFWVRQGSAIADAEASDIPNLYLRQVTEDEVVRQPIGQLPPSQSNVREFVGRMPTIDSVFQWMSMSDEPRAFLYGKGGSGKSTIAQEVFKQIRSNGGAFKLGGESLIDQVIFLSAKRQYLDVEKQSVASFLGNDFTDEAGLYRGILLLGGVADSNIDDEPIEKLKPAIQQFFNETACFIVIDDIDTLTTAGEEGGFDFLYRVAVRSPKISKFLYTLRNRPTQSLRSSIEVPGMTGDELRSFVETCAEQFKVPKPSQAFIEGPLSEVSEGRPLVVESIILLRRQSGSYERALAMFERGSGDDVRSYVFQREWEAIPKQSRGKEVLGCLALYGRPMSFGDIAAVSRLEESKVKDAIAAIQEMFLISEEDDQDTLFSLGALTKTFIHTQVESLDMFATIKARVDHFKRSAYPESPVLAKINRELRKAEYSARNGDEELLDDLIWKLNSDRFPPDIVENPRFVAMRGYAATLKSRPNLAAVRADFRNAVEMGYRPPLDDIKRWFLSEAASDSAYKNTLEIEQLITSDKRYPLSERSELRMMRGVFLYNFAKANILTDQFRAVDLLKESLEAHMRAYAGLLRSKSALASRSEKLAQNTAYLFGQRAAKLDTGDLFIDTALAFIRDHEITLDPLAEPMVHFLQLQFQRNSHALDILNRLFSKADLLIKELQKSSNFAWGSNKQMLMEQLQAFRVAAKSTIEALRKAQRQHA
ncbi:RNA-binding domain-containing protein [Sphingomonas sp.]|uniref:RNA-binding domain-containing protein n=1 Tax=Sphingomonas sp. TaxID=28214 RepID=UPI00183A9879|nr:RNA-binding domain-containing protein [Sphingomonas sp.]MBA3510989.1 putative DNA binding domain-containing protein [Sphingomonas sp.]